MNLTIDQPLASTHIKICDVAFATWSTFKQYLDYDKQLQSYQLQRNISFISLPFVANRAWITGCSFKLIIFRVAITHSSCISYFNLSRNYSALILHVRAGSTNPPQATTRSIGVREPRRRKSSNASIIPGCTFHCGGRTVKTLCSIDISDDEKRPSW